MFFDRWSLHICSRLPTRKFQKHKTAVPQITLPKTEKRNKEHFAMLSFGRKCNNWNIFAEILSNEAGSLT